MRLSKTIDLGEGRTATVRELRVADVRQLLAAADGWKALELRALAGGEGLGPVLALVGDCLEVSGAGWDALAFSEVEAVWEAFRAVNASFFRLLALAGVALPTLAEPAA